MPLVSTIALLVEGFDLPGRSCVPGAAGEAYGDVHVGVQRGRETVDLVAGDAPTAAWTLPVTVKEADGGVDFAGPFVHGRRGDRFVYLSWGVVDGGDFTMFRRAKLHFADIPGDTLRAARRAGVLRCRVRMTDSCGNPRCARVRPPDAEWSSPET